MTFLKRKNAKRNLTVVLAVLSACVLVVNIGNDNNSTIEVEAEKKVSNGTQMYTVPSAEKIFINGVVTPEKTETFTHKSEYGVMENVKVQSGEYVDKGYHMFSYRDTLKEEELKRKEKEITSLESDIKELQENSAENRQEIIYLNNKIRDMKKEIDDLKSSIVTNVYAPFSGEIHIEKSTTSEDGNNELTIMLDSKDYYLDGKISEQDFAKIKVGTPTEIYMFSTKEAKKGTITYISTRPETVLDEETRNANLSKYRVKIGFTEQDNLVNGYHAQAKIDTQSKEIRIPVSAIGKDRGSDSYYVLVDEMGIAKKRIIETSFSETDAMATVKSGLSENEMIIENLKESKIKEGDTLYERGEADIEFNK